ncbi:hypothetical protein CCUS01_17316 [Colletotrichum cuscutae]|uniref:Uncharacterized protein n=1 Tax=Colletotrichum cuscutae TaxID=1209917 RepID=A0AAI9V6J2_9PEZI|nr:hypothetical protein CCUS01_17316 [Colletotrichum cuscutae]
MLQRYNRGGEDESEMHVKSREVWSFSRAIKKRERGTTPREDGGSKGVIQLVVVLFPSRVPALLLHRPLHPRPTKAISSTAPRRGSESRTRQRVLRVWLAWLLERKFWQSHHQTNQLALNSQYHTLKPDRPLACCVFTKRILISRFDRCSFSVSKRHEVDHAMDIRTTTTQNVDPTAGRPPMMDNSPPPSFLPPLIHHSSKREGKRARKKRLHTLYPFAAPLRGQLELKSSETALTAINILVRRAERVYIPDLALRLLKKRASHAAPVQEGETHYVQYNDAGWFPLCVYCPRGEDDLTEGFQGFLNTKFGLFSISRIDTDQNAAFPGEGENKGQALSWPRRKQKVIASSAPHYRRRFCLANEVPCPPKAKGPGIVALPRLRADAKYSKSLQNLGGGHDPAHREPPVRSATGYRAFRISRHAPSLNLSFSLGHIPTIDYLDLTATHALPGSSAIVIQVRLFIAEEGTKIPPRPSYASPEPRCGHFPANYPYLPHCSALWVNLEGGEEFVSPRRKATHSHKLGLSSRSVLRRIPQQLTQAAHKSHTHGPPQIPPPNHYAIPLTLFCKPAPLLREKKYSNKILREKKKKIQHGTGKTPIPPAALLWTEHCIPTSKPPYGVSTNSRLVFVSLPALITQKAKSRQSLEPKYSRHPFTEVNKASTVVSSLAVTNPMTGLPEVVPMRTRFRTPPQHPTPYFSSHASTGTGNRIVSTSEEGAWRYRIDSILLEYLGWLCQAGDSLDGTRHIFPVPVIGNWTAGCLQPTASSTVESDPGHFPIEEKQQKDGMLSSPAAFSQISKLPRDYSSLLSTLDSHLGQSRCRWSPTKNPDMLGLSTYRKRKEERMWSFLEPFLRWLTWHPRNPLTPDPIPMPSSPNFDSWTASLELVTSRALRALAEPSQRNALSRLFFFSFSTKAPSPVAVTDPGDTYLHAHLTMPPNSNLLSSRIYQVTRSLLAQKAEPEKLSPVVNYEHIAITRGFHLVVYTCPHKTAGIGCGSNTINLTIPHYQPHHARTTSATLGQFSISRAVDRENTATQLQYRQSSIGGEEKKDASSFLIGVSSALSNSTQLKDGKLVSREFGLTNKDEGRATTGKPAYTPDAATPTDPCFSPAGAMRYAAVWAHTCVCFSAVQCLYTFYREYFLICLISINNRSPVFSLCYPLLPPPQSQNQMKPELNASLRPAAPPPPHSRKGQKRHDILAKDIKQGRHGAATRCKPQGSSAVRIPNGVRAPPQTQAMKPPYEPPN